MKKVLPSIGMIAVLWAVASAEAGPPSPPVARAIENVMVRMRTQLSVETLLRLDHSAVEKFITPVEKRTLAEDYWAFRVNVPARVSVMRHRDQAVVPFWLPETGFRLTNLRVRNEEYEYEVWQKDFPAGRVGLGINGFEKHRVHYFVCVQPQQRDRRLRLKPLYPPTQVVSVMRKGATIYHDWPDLVLTDVPAELQGAALLPTIRGRAREAHLVEGFRTTPFPSSTRPDQISLTFAADPGTSVAVQWRTSTLAGTNMLEWRARGESRWRVLRASRQTLTDGRILNDPCVLRHSITLAGLKPGTTYQYRVGWRGGTWSDVYTFRTAPPAGSPFSFVWLSDTHNRPDTAELLADAVRRYPDAAFCAITGDLVGTGQYRDDWDQLFAYVADFARERPLVPTIGNHDTIDGLGADLYLSLFTLPRNGARGVQPERSYAFTYSDALFLVLDCTDSIEAQRPWLERTLKSSRARWKIAMFHFPPYALSQDYPEIEREWVPLFDRYHVDLVLCGHVHHLQRSHPLRGGKIVSSPSEGTIYLISVAVAQRETFTEKPTIAAVAMEPGPPLYHAFRINSERLEMRCHDPTGRVWDQLVIEK